MEEKIETKNLVILAIVIILVVAVLAGAIVYWQSKKIVPPTEVKLPAKEVKEDSTSAINKELEGIQTLDLEKEFQEIDQDLNSL